MADAKTKVRGASVDAFLEAIPNDQIRDDCRTVAALMRKATKAEPRMWGTNIVGFGTRQQRYADGREATWMVTAFAPRKQNITLYLDPAFDGRDELLPKLGKHTIGQSCLHIKRLSDVHLPTLEKIVKASVRRTLENQ